MIAVVVDVYLITGDDNNLGRWIKVMVENELQKRDFNIVSRMVEKVLRDKNYIHNELGLTKEDIINVIRSDIRQCVERCMRNTYGDDNNLERWIKVMVENELQKRDFNIVSRMVEKVLRDKMLDNIEIIVRNKDIND